MTGQAKACGALLRATRAGALALLWLNCCHVQEGKLRTDETPAPSHAPDAQAADPAMIHRRAISVDMHADTVQFIIDEGADINQRLATTQLDAPRMRDGGLDAQFFSIWVEPQFYGRGGEGAVARADEQIKAVRALAEEHPETWMLASTAADIRRAASEGKLAALIGLEGGYAIDALIEPLVEDAGRRAVGRGSAKRIARDRVREREYAARLPAVYVSRVVDHVDHIVRLVGIEHVGVGSDFDGIQAVPADLSTVADLPNLTAELLRRGYTEEDVDKILGGNILRVMEEVERK